MCSNRASSHFVLVDDLVAWRRLLNPFHAKQLIDLSFESHAVTVCNGNRPTARHLLSEPCPSRSRPGTDPILCSKASRLQ